MSLLYERIKEIRIDTGLNQEMFGKRIGLAKSSVSWVEKGKQTISDNIIKNIIAEFCINESWLKDGIGAKYDDKLKREKEYMQNELQYMSDVLIERQHAFFNTLKDFDEDEQLEMITALEEIYAVLNIPCLDKKNYFFYYETMAGMLVGIKGYLELLSQKPKLSNNDVTEFFEELRGDIIELTKLFVSDTEIDSILKIDPVDAAESSEDLTKDIKAKDEDQEIYEMMELLRTIPKKEREDIKLLMSIKAGHYDSLKKKTRSSIYTHGEQAATKLNA